MSNSNLSVSDQTKFRLDEINKIKDYFNLETKERKETTKKLSKYIALFGYADKIFITLSTSFGTLSHIKSLHIKYTQKMIRLDNIISKNN